MSRWFWLLATLTSGVLITVTVMLAAPAEEAFADRTVRFGLRGAQIDPPGGAGGSTRDRIEPGVIIINSGTTLDFRNIGAPHRVAIYDKNLMKDGVAPTTFLDINATAGAGNFLDDPAGRLALGASGADLSHRFINTTGALEQYLVICAFRPHFQHYGMAAYVLVRPQGAGDRDDDD
jgi:hypothetical protein